MYWDLAAFYAINHLPHPPILDWTARLIHYLTRGGIIYYPFILYGLFRPYKLFRRWPILLAAGIAFTYLVTDIILKHAAHRLRPSLALANVITVHPLPATFSFPSGQAAAAAFAAGVLWSIGPKKFRIPAVIFALVVGLDRIYMGHHYPSDVLAGYVIGAAMAGLMSLLFRPFPRRPVE